MRLFKGIGLMARRNTVTMNTRAYNVQVCRDYKPIECYIKGDSFLLL